MDFETIFLACFQSNMRVPLVSDQFTHGVVSVSVHCNTTPLRIKKNDQRQHGTTHIRNACAFSSKKN